MARKYLLILIGILFNLFSSNSFSQTLAPNQPEQNACDALIICGNFYTPYSYQGVGSVNDITTTPCSSGEANSVFFELHVNSAGTIQFDIVPNDAEDDYDFAVIDITNGSCSNITQSQIIRCNFNNNQQPNNYYTGGIVGLNPSANTNYVAGGAFGQQYVNEINANAGDVYLIMVNNFGHDDCFGSCPGSGFLLDFTGSTATFNQPDPPAFDQIEQSCDHSQSVTIQLTDNVLCNSIAPDGSDFYLTPTGTVASAAGIGCGNGNQGYTDEIVVTFQGTLPYGQYVIHAQEGTDTNSLLGICGTELQLPDQLNFSVLNDAIPMVSLDSPACQTITLHVGTDVLCSSIDNDGSNFKVTGPSNVVVDGAVGVNCVNGETSVIQVHLADPIAVDGTYHLVAQIGGDGNTVTDICNNSIQVGDFLPFVINSFNGQLVAGPDTATCRIGINLFSSNSGTPPAGGFQYHWTPETGIYDPNSGSSAAVLQPGHNRYQLETVDVNGCYLRDSLDVYMEVFEGSINPEDATTCLGNPIPVYASGGTQYQWSSNSQMTGSTADLSCVNCDNPYINPTTLGTHTYYVNISNDINCLVQKSVDITVLPTPAVTASPHDTTIKYGTTITLNASGTMSYYWTPESSLDDPLSAHPQATPKKNTTYVVTGMDGNGCMGQDSVQVNIDFRSPVNIPNAFSPNGDGLNDEFKIVNLTFQKILAFEIFDRWGKRVFHTTNPDKGWDGTLNGKPLPLGTYFYFIKLGYPDNYQEEFKGSLTLIR